MKVLMIPGFATVCSDNELVMIQVLQTLVIETINHIESMCIGEDLWSKLEKTGETTFEGYTIKLS